jgi:ribosomal protein L37AE/L43A
MKTEITLGRSPENDIVIDQPVVGRSHLKITYLSESELLVEDVGSNSFTYINNVRIKRKHISPSDLMMLGNYQIDLEKLFSDIIKIVRDSRSDYSQEFKHLQTIYSIYEKRVSELKRKSQLLPMIFKSAFTFGAIIIAYFMINDQQLRNLVMTIAGLLGGFITLTVNEDSKVRDAIDILTLKLEAEYKCPKCEKSLSSKRWQHWASKRKCDNCGAIWVI